VVPEVLSERIVAGMMKVQLDDDDVADEIGNMAATAEALRLTAAAPPKNQNLGPEYE
jgi:DNA-directed RNA polymerase subunit omega